MDVVAQIFGMLGFIILVSSLQFKRNKTFLAMQSLGSLMFFINYFLIGAWSGVFYNFAAMCRGLLFIKNDKKKWKLLLIEALFILGFVFSAIMLKGQVFNIFISSLPFLGMSFMSIFMWIGNSKKTRVFQFAVLSPTWIVYNIVNFTIGGILCEIFNMISSVIFLIRTKNEKMEEKL